MTAHRITPLGPAPRVLLISPVFHGYWRSISRALARRGYDVISHLYDSRSTSQTLRHKVFRELPAQLGVHRDADERPTAAAVDAITRSRPDIMVAIRVDTLGPAFWEAMAAHPRSVLWLYDEVRRTAHTADTLRAVTALASYSSVDVERFASQGLSASHVPNGFDPIAAVSAIPHRDEVTFVGARYPNREALLRSLRAHGVPVRAYGRDWSDHPVDRLRTWRWGRVDVPNGRDISLADAYGTMKHSVATLNMHFDQDGFTMRTFEAAGVGAVQLIDRQDVIDFYEPGSEIAVFESPEEAAELAYRAHRDPAWASKIRENGRKRTLAEHTFDHRIATLEELWV